MDSKKGVGGPWGTKRGGVHHTRRRRYPPDQECAHFSFGYCIQHPRLSTCEFPLAFLHCLTPCPAHTCGTRSNSSSFFDLDPSILLYFLLPTLEYNQSNSYRLPIESKDFFFPHLLLLFGFALSIGNNNSFKAYSKNQNARNATALCHRCNSLISNAVFSNPVPD